MPAKSKPMAFCSPPAGRRKTSAPASRSRARYPAANGMNNAATAAPNMAAHVRHIGNPRINGSASNMAIFQSVTPSAPWSAPVRASDQDGVRERAGQAAWTLWFSLQKAWTGQWHRAGGGDGVGVRRSGIFHNAARPDGGVAADVERTVMVNARDGVSPRRDDAASFCPQRDAIPRPHRNAPTSKVTLEPTAVLKLTITCVEFFVTQ